MKKVSIFVILLIAFSIHTKAGVGVLVNAEYNKHELAEFQQALLNRVTLKPQILTIKQATMIEIYKAHIQVLFPGENFEDVIRNSTVEILPADFQNNHKVGYLGADNTEGMDWFARNPRTEAGPEEGLKYKGKFWASKYCWNPISPNILISSEVGQQTRYTPPAQQNTGTGGGNTNTVTINPPGQEVSGNTFYGIYNQGRNDRQADMANDALIFMAIQKSTPSGCNSCGVAQTTGTLVVSQPSVGYQSQVSNQGCNSCGRNGCYGSCRNTASYRPNVLDYANTFFNGANAAANVKNAFWGYNVNLRGLNINGGGGYYGNGNGGPVDPPRDPGGSGGGTGSGFGGLLGN